MWKAFETSSILRFMCSNGHDNDFVQSTLQSPRQTATRTTTALFSFGLEKTRKMTYILGSKTQQNRVYQGLQTLRQPQYELILGVTATR